MIGALLLTALIAYSFNLAPSEPTSAQVERAATAAAVATTASNEAAAGTAGSAASHAAAIFVSARTVSDAILADEALAADIAAGEATPDAPATPPKKEDLKSVKKVLERTF